jgi:hypothetical protein
MAESAMPESHAPARVRKFWIVRDQRIQVGLAKFDRRFLIGGYGRPESLERLLGGPIMIGG